MDNCSENKNKIVFGFLSDLVSKGVFSEVYVGFLMVGHTHEDIDQFFSVISTWLKKIETICPDPLSLGNAIKAAFENSKKLRSQTQKCFMFVPWKFLIMIMTHFMLHAYLNKTLHYYYKPH